MSISQAAAGLDLTDEALARRFGQGTLRRGRTYASQQRVGPISVGGAEGGVVLSAPGEGTRTYQTVISQMSGRRGSWMATHCSCPLGGDCKHAVAVLLAVRQEAEPAHPARAARRDAPAWQRVLQVIAEEAGGVPRGAPLALQFSLVREGLFALQPLQRGASGRWIRGGLQWDHLGGPTGQYQARHLEALRAVDASGGAGHYASYYSRDRAVSRP